MKKELTENEKEVLREAKVVLERPYNGVNWGSKNAADNRYNGWFTPMCVGGSSNSHHSYTLKKLVGRKLVETEKCCSWSGLRGSRVYRITAAGVQYVEDEKKIVVKLIYF